MAGVDRISKLPEPILHHILSFLSQKHAIQTSALSKSWRRVGPTRPKIELCERCFEKSGRASFLSVLGKTLQRYYHQNLSVDEFIFEMSSSDSDYPGIDSQFTNDPGKTLFKCLKRLSLTSVHIKDEKTLEKIMHSCPLIEYLLLSDCKGLKSIQLNIFQAEFLTELHLTGRNVYAYGHLRGLNIIVPTDQLLLIKRLKTLSFKRVNIVEETLEKIMCSCPLIERLLLNDCVGLRNIQLIKNNNNNLKHFSVSFYLGSTESLAIHSTAIETISIEKCPNWYGHDIYSFPRLKSLCLTYVKLSAEFFESFSSSNFPSLEELQLEYCYGFQEIQLTSCSIKRLLLIMTYSINPIKVTIYAPNIHYFKFSGYCPPQLIFTSETAGKEWKSHLRVWSSSTQSKDKDINLLWFIQLSKLLNSLRESQISLLLHLTPLKNLKVEDITNDAGFCNPVPLEHINVKGGYESYSIPDLLNCLFLICRPRCIAMNLPTIKLASDLKREKVKLAEFITFKTIRSEGKMSRAHYLWERDLEEISVQFWDEKSQGWDTVRIEGTSFHGFTSRTVLKIRFLVKWIN